MFDTVRDQAIEALAHVGEHPRPVANETQTETLRDSPTIVL